MLLMPRGGAAILYLCLGSNQIVSRVTVTYSRVGPRARIAARFSLGSQLLHLIAGVYRWKERHSHMKTLTITNICLPIAAMILTVALAIPAAAGDLVPFKGTMQGHDTDTPCSPPQSQCVVVTTTGTGIGTHLGDFSFTQVAKVNRAARTSAGSAHWIAANGDSIDTTFTGSAELTATPGVISITEIHTITGGTGRFSGAQGSFTVERLASGVTFLTSGSFHGTITSPGAAH